MTYIKYIISAVLHCGLACMAGLVPEIFTLSREGSRVLQSVLYVCLSVCEHISCGHGSVLLWWHCATSCISFLWMTSPLAVVGCKAMRGRLELFLSKPESGKPVYA